MSEEKKTQRVKIEYDGGPAYMARVTDADTGELIPGVFQADIHINVAKSPYAVLHSHMPVTNVTIDDLEIHTHCPLCGQEVVEKQEKEVTLRELRPGAVFVTRDGIYAVKGGTFLGDQYECTRLTDGHYVSLAHGNETLVKEVKLPQLERGDQHA
jgi:hypothetical protein